MSNTSTTTSLSPPLLTTTTTSNTLTSSTNKNDNNNNSNTSQMNTSTLLMEESLLTSNSASQQHVVLSGKQESKTTTSSSSPLGTITTTVNSTSSTSSSPLKQFLSKIFSKRRKSQVEASLKNSDSSPQHVEENKAFRNLLTPNDSSSSLNNPNNNISNITSHSTNNIINSSTSGRKSKRLSATFFKRRHTTQLSQSPIHSPRQDIDNFREEAIRRQIQNEEYLSYNQPIQQPTTTTSPSSSVTTICSGLSLSLTTNNSGNTPHPNRTRRSSSSKSIPDNADTFFDESSAFNLDDLMWITMEPTTTRTSLRPKTVSSNSLISVTSNNGNSSTGRRDSAAHSSVNDEEIVDDLEVIIPSITIDDGSVTRTLSPTTSSTNNSNIQPPTRHVNSWDLDDEIMEAHNSFSFSPGSMTASNIINL